MSNLRYDLELGLIDTGVSEGLTKIIEKFRELSAVLGSYRDEASSVNDKNEELADGLLNISSVADTASGSMQALTGSMESLNTSLEDFNAVSEEMQSKLEGLNERVLALGTSIGEGLAVSIGIASSNFDEFNESLDEVQNKVNDTTDAVNDLNTGILTLGESFAGIMDSITPFNEMFEEGLTPNLKDYIEEVKNLLGIYPDLKEQTDENTESNDGLNTTLADLVEEGESAQGSIIGLKDASDHLEETTGALVKIFLEDIKTVGDLKDAFKLLNIPTIKQTAAAIALMVALDLLSRAVKIVLALVKRLTEAFLDFISRVPFIGKLLGRNAEGGVAPAPIPMLAKGGHVRGSGFAIAGEAGPELLHLRSGGLTVTPLSSGSGSLALGGGGYSSANITVQLDSKVIGRAVGQRLVDDVKLRTLMSY